MYSKHPRIYESDEVDGYLEISDEMKPYLHVNIKKLHIKALRNAFEGFKLAMKELGESKDVYALADDPQIMRLMRMFGFNPTGLEYVGDDNIARSEYKCHLE